MLTLIRLKPCSALFLVNVLTILVCATSPTPLPNVVRKRDTRMGEYEQRVHKNWSGTDQSHPSRIFYPTKPEDIINIIQYANTNNISVRFAGTGHSWNGLTSTDGYVVNTDAFKKVLNVNRGRCQVQVECGMKLHELFDALHTEGLALPTQGYIAAQSVAGSISTGTHGSAHVGSISNFIVGMKIVDAQGKLHVLTEDKTPDELAAARISLGALGFIYSVTLQCRPAFVLEHKRTKMNLDYALQHYMDFYNNNDFCWLMCHPMSDTALVFEFQETDKAPTDNTLIELNDDIIFSKVMNVFSIASAHYLPGLTNDFFSTTFSILSQPPHRDYSYKLLSPIRNPQPVENYVEGEIAIPIQAFPQAVAAVKRLYETYKSPDFELVGVMLCRFAKASNNALLAQNYDRDVAYISLTTLSIFPPVHQFYTDFQLIMLKFGGRPHWGKVNVLNKDLVNYLYGDNAVKFNQVRKTYDPKGIFSNDFVKQLFD